MNWNKFFHAPLQYMGRVYHNKYHLNYVHARKLFVFDIGLLLGVLVLISSTIAWHLYDPSVVDDVPLRIVAVDATGTPLTRIASGEPVTYTLSYANESESILTNATIELHLPAYFTVATITAHNLPFNSENQTFTLPDLTPNTTGTIHISGVYFGTPDEYEHVSAILRYTQDGRSEVEAAVSTIISSLRDAVLVGSLDMPTLVRSRGTYPIRITLSNIGDRPLRAIALPETHTYGTIRWTTSTIDTLAGDATTTIDGQLITDIPTSVSDYTFAIAPLLRINGTLVPQDTLEQPLTVVHPAVTLSDVSWDTEVANPGTTVNARITMQNTGDTPLESIRVILPINPNIISPQRSVAITPELRSTAEGLQFDTSAALAPGETYSLTIPLAVQYVPAGATDIRYTLSPIVLADAAGGTTPVQSTRETNSLAIGTTLILDGHARYYTAEGDQLGRGPLPPVVGQETKYWVLFTVRNTTSRVENAEFTATLGPNTTWTGRSSVSLGEDLVYNAATRQASWSLSSLASGQTIGLYMELATTPTADMLGTIPTLIERASVNGRDTYIDTELARSIGTITADLSQDTRGSARGVTVQSN